MAQKCRFPQEFRIAAVNLRPSLRSNLERRLKVVFDTIDADGNGYLTPDEVAQMGETLDTEVRDMLSAVLLAAREQQQSADEDDRDEDAGGEKQEEIPIDIFKHLDVSRAKSAGARSPRYVPNKEGDAEEVEDQGDGIVTWEEFR
jgi:hypothetical protein|eukprot:COSAG06_NODE_20680_length_785_cov_2.425656_1_plen_145_part_00